MREIKESYRRIDEADERFDIEFWQAQGDQAIFEAALEMILDYQLLRYGHAEQPRLERTVEYYGKIEDADLIVAKKPARSNTLITSATVTRGDLSLIPPLPFASG